MIKRLTIKHDPKDFANPFLLEILKTSADRHDRVQTKCPNRAGACPELLPKGPVLIRKLTNPNRQNKEKRPHKQNVHNVF